LHKSLDFYAKWFKIVIVKRYIYDNVLEDLKKKMVFITGPRQVGKTYLAKDIMKNFKSPVYLNFDDIDDMQMIKGRSWRLNSDLVVLDEIHKMKGWKNYLKGTYDTKSSLQNFLVTGNARLDTFRQTGDSLAGRYFLYHLNPLSVKEISGNMSAYEAVVALNTLGGFPEPFLSGSEEYSERWRRQYYTDIVREDILDFSKISEIKAIKLLLEMLRKRIGVPLSYTSLAQDIQISPNTVRKYIEILESLNILFLIRPLHRNIARAILKEPKVYFYDSGYVDSEEGVRLENTVAVCLLKHVQYLQDVKGKEISLFYIRTKDKREVDFAIVDKEEVTHIIEVKLSDSGVSRNLKYFKERIPRAQAIQLVHNTRHDREVEGIQVMRAGKWLSELEA